MKRVIAIGIVIFVFLVITVLPAFAGTTVYSGTITESSAIYPNGRPDDADCGDQIDDLLPLKYHYELRTLTVSETGDYTYTDLRDTAGTIDIEVAFYEIGNFDPANPMNNCLGSLDDSNIITLQTGITYLLAVTSWDVPVVGDYSFELTGPGNIIEPSDAVSASCPVPLPSNAVLVSLPAGAPAYFAPDFGSGTNFSIPAGTWYSFETSGDYTHLWIACQANTVWVPTSAVSP